MQDASKVADLIGSESWQGFTDSGQDPQTCAGEFSVTLPAGFKALATSAGSAIATFATATATVTPTKSTRFPAFSGGANAKAVGGFVAAAAVVMGVVGNIV
ncbi:hypothetical protein K440DRAFT_645315 [Wilcoxina mikolae CBS 423.85]|nr:hypothetical protein K440DRAFT_645315 [Wilcoxina mikolae CBS 423.85]